MEIPRDFDLREGIYASWVTIARQTFMGALHYGSVPVFGQKDKSLEVFLLDARDEDIGDTSTIGVTLVKRLRDIQTFADSVELTAQIKRDVDRARVALEEVR